jgi:hypothetical protein
MPIGRYMGLGRDGAANVAVRNKLVATAIIGGASRSRNQ